MILFGLLLGGISSLFPGPCRGLIPEKESRLGKNVRFIKRRPVFWPKLPLKTAQRAYGSQSPNPILAPPDLGD